MHPNIYVDGAARLKSVRLSRGRMESGCINHRRSVFWFNFFRAENQILREICVNIVRFVIKKLTTMCVNQLTMVPTVLNIVASKGKDTYTGFMSEITCFKCRTLSVGTRIIYINVKHIPGGHAVSTVIKTNQTSTKYLVLFLATICKLVIITSVMLIIHLFSVWTRTKTVCISLHLLSI